MHFHFTKISPFRDFVVSLQFKTAIITMDKHQQDIAYFLSFCTEQYKNEKHLSGSDAVVILEKYGVLDYLAEHYEMLHTQSRQWLMEEINEFIALRKREVV